VQTLMEYIVGKTALISLNGPDWEKYRGIVYGCIEKVDFARIVSDLLEGVDSTSQYFAGAGRELDALPILRNLALAIIGKNVYNRPLTGINNGTQAAATVMIDELIRRTTGSNPLDTLFFVPTENNLILNHARKVFHDDIGAEIANRRAKAAGTDVDHEDMLKYFLADGRLDDQELQDAVAAAVFGSTETYTAFLGSGLYAVGARKEIQDKIAAEAKKAFATPGQLDYADLKYTNLVVKEILRLYTPVPLVQRTLTMAATLAKDTPNAITVPKGTGIWAAQWVIHRSESNYKDPLVFRPERFLEKVPEYANIPFSAGKRNCVAAAFAEKVLTVMLARLVENTEYTTAGPAELLSTSNAFTEWPANGVPVVPKPRKA